MVTGDIAGLFESAGDDHKEQLASGVVSKVTQSYVSLAFDETYDTLVFDDVTQYRLVKLANDVTYRRIKRYKVKKQTLQNIKFQI